MGSESKQLISETLNQLNCQNHRGRRIEAAPLRLSWSEPAEWLILPLELRCDRLLRSALKFRGLGSKYLCSSPGR